MAYSWGSGSDGQLGLGNQDDYSIPMKLDIDFKICKIGGGGSHSLIVRILIFIIYFNLIYNVSLKLSDQGSIYMCGNGDDGKLCENESTNRFIKVKMLQNESFKMISAGWNHSVALRNDGKLLSWGNNQFAQLGTEDEESKVKFKSNPSIIEPSLYQVKISFVSCGLRHTIAISDNGLAFSWGENRHGQCGVKGVKRIYKPMIIEHLKDVYSIESSAGTRHSLVLSKEGHVYSFGCNRFGQCGFTPSKNSLLPSKIEFDECIFINKVRCGWNHSIVISDEHKSVISFGRNDYGQLGIGHFDSVDKPTKVLTLCDIEIEDISVGSEHNIALTKDGDVYSWGWAEHGQLGHGNEENVCYPKIVEALKELKKQWKGIGCGYGCSFIFS